MRLCQLPIVFFHNSLIYELRIRLQTRDNGQDPYLCFQITFEAWRKLNRRKALYSEMENIKSMLKFFVVFVNIMTE